MARGVRRKSSHFDSTDIVIGVAIFAGVILALWLLSMFLNRNDGTKRCNNPKKLFRSLCHVHQLDRASRRVLRQMVRHQRLTQPARLFLEPERFESVNLSPTLRTQMALVDELRGKLFAEEEKSVA